MLQPAWWFDHAGGAALAVVTSIIFAESGLLVGFFLPGDSLLFFTGFLTSAAAARTAPFTSFARHVPSVWIVVACLAAAAIAGDQVGYVMRRGIGPTLFTRPESRLFKPENVLKARDFFERHGAKSIVLARFVPIMRTFTPVTAGVANMRYRTFVTYNVLGGVLWAVGLTALGHYLGQVTFIRHNIEYAIVVLVAASLAPAIVEIRRARRGPDGVEAEPPGSTSPERPRHGVPR
jgi:membrane-associated protein